tara:strand:- start:3652 stop:4056 length:405 start_codon:yes stop_codon:yes gene_type:complete
MKLNELEILEDDFDLFVALDDHEKIEFLFDATQKGVEAAVLKQVTNLSERYVKSVPVVATEDYQVGTQRLCITSFPDKIHINSTSLKAIRSVVDKFFNDGILLMRIPTKKSEFDLYRYFRAYKVIGKVGPFCSN